MVETNTNVRAFGMHRADICRALADNILMRIGDKWTIKVVISLSEGPMRYNEMFRTIGSVSQRMLTLTLKQLERDGLVSRTVLPTNPPSVEYRLTELGQSLIEPLRGLWGWVLDHHTEINQAREEYDGAREQVS